jgi:hypothetical protein
MDQAFKHQSQIITELTSELQKALNRIKELENMQKESQGEE